MPGLVTIICHAECLGAWTSFWVPCWGTWRFEHTFHGLVYFRHINVPDVDGGGGFHTVVAPYGVSSNLVSRKDICGWRWNMN
eukprot:2475031-Amphidinium_carterae.1